MKITKGKHPSRRPTWRGRTLFASILLSGAALTPGAHAQRLFSENFDALSFGPNPEEASKGAAVWTKTPPTGWAIDDTGMPGYGTADYAANDGRTEWAGWSFADARWWPTVDNQRRAEFLLATGGAAIADPDEWDDATHLKGLFNSYLTTPEISVAGKAANSLVISFDSSWRPEGRDDGGANWPVNEAGEPINNQTAVITAKWDNGAEVEVLRWDSISDSPTFHPDAPNEMVLAELKNPAGAQKLTLKFGLIEGANDWWWAFDNLAVGEPPFASGISGTGIGFNARIREGLGKTVNESAAITAKLDGQTITVTKSRDAELAEVLFFAHDQSPKIFAPRSSHTVELAFTSSDGRQITDTLQFVAPGYATASATPITVTGSIAETTYLSVDESKGVKLELDGTAVTGATVTRTDLTAADGSDLPDRLDIRFGVTTPFASASSHTLKLTYTTKTAQEVVETVTFDAPAYQVLPAALGTALGTGADAGIRWKTHQLEGARPGGTTIAEAEKQLAGTLGASVHDPAAQVAGGYFDVPYVNFEQTPADAGNFNASSTIAEQAVGDEVIPGIPGTTGSTDNIAAEALAYVQIPTAGIYTMVVNSDDGFQVSVGNATNATYQVLGAFDGGRGSSDSVFYFNAQPGVYLFRLLYMEGGG
ncbi:MAG: hypothetical protein IT580_10035, partial [Verrucomicrobiales bacterium]|nr:hypothetical protein [Verrucomicrobiales bacterium]